MNILDTIVEEKKTEVARLPQGNLSATALKAAMDSRPDKRDFLAALHHPKQGSVALIAEIKKASPSAGVICADFDPVRIAKEYELGGASCLSVLTDQKFFQGSLEDLKRVREAVRLPLLRKDFIIDEKQILEAIQWGADAILLIVAILSDTQLSHLHTLAKAAGLAVLVEVHDEAELERGRAAGAELIGVNNRNLKTFQVDLGTTERLAAQLKKAPVQDRSYLLVAESGIQTRAHVERVAACGAKAILVGESLMRNGAIRQKIDELLGLPSVAD